MMMKKMKFDTSFAVATLTLLSTTMICTGAELQKPVSSTQETLATRPLVEQSYLVTANGLKIRQALLDDTEYNREKFETVPKIQYVTIHNTAEPFEAMQERNFVNTRTTTVTSFHFAVDEAEAVQILPDNTHGWHAGDRHGAGNMESIGIEICRSQCIGSETNLYEQAEANAVKLAAYLLQKYQLPVDALRMHQNWSGKFCPHRILCANSFDSFKQRVAVALAKEAQEQPPVLQTQLTTDRTHWENSAISVRTSTHGTAADFYTADGLVSTTPDELIANLKQRGIQEVAISSWVRNYDDQALLQALRQAGFTVRGYYILQEGIPDYERKNIVPERPESVLEPRLNEKASSAQ